MTNSPPISLSKARRWEAIIALVIVIIALLVKWQSTWMPENVYVPTPKMPVPNTFDDYAAAVGLMRDSDAIGRAIDAKPTIDRHQFTLTEEQKLVAENAPAFAKMHDGFTHTYLQPPIRSFDGTLPYLSKDRALARAVLLKSKVDEASGDWRTAMNDRIDDIKLGSDLPRGSELIGMLVGIACQALGRGRTRDATKVIDHLSSNDARAASKRLAEIDAAQVPISQTLTEEKWSTQAGLVELTSKDHNWRRVLLGEYGVQTDSVFTSVDWAANTTYWLLEIESPRTAYAHFTDDMDKTIALSSRPWPLQRAASPIPMPTDPVSRILLPVYQGATYVAMRNMVLNRLLDCQLALRAYYVDHAEYPIQLSDLTPKYLPAIPLDPFSNNHQVKYKRTGAKYLLYSIGPDAADNGGTPIRNAGNSGMEYAASAPDAKGDVVAGVNY